jgi:serine/threonine-protein phosphatase 6 regulatory subunit 3
VWWTSAAEAIFFLFVQNSSEVHANAAETLSAITRIAQSALASKLASPKFVGKLFQHVLEDPESKSTVVHALSVCISLLDPKRAATIAAAGAARGQHVTEPVSTANPDTVEGMLQRLGDLLKVLDVSADDKVLFTTYGQLQPPLGIHRLKVNLYSFIYNVIICVINLKHCSYTIVADNILQAALVS